MAAEAGTVKLHRSQAPVALRWGRPAAAAAAVAVTVAVAAVAVAVTEVNPSGAPSGSGVPRCPP